MFGGRRRATCQKQTSSGAKRQSSGWAAEGTGQALKRVRTHRFWRSLGARSLASTTTRDCRMTFAHLANHSEIICCARSPILPRPPGGSSETFTVSNVFSVGAERRALAQPPAEAGGLGAPLRSTRRQKSELRILGGRRRGRGGFGPTHGTSVVVASWSMLPQM